MDGAMQGQKKARHKPTIQHKKPKLHRNIRDTQPWWFIVKHPDSKAWVDTKKADQYLKTHARVPRCEAVVVDEVLPDGYGVAAAAERLDDQLSIRLSRARARFGDASSNQCAVQQPALTVSGDHPLIMLLAWMAQDVHQNTLRH
jgi:hypothetical protein